MERTRVAKVEDVTLARRGEQVVGTLHLTPHHIIFSHIPSLPDSAQPSATPVRPRELWITYPIISFCTFRPAPAASRQPSSIRLRCRDFAFVCFYFASETKGRDVYESIKQWTCKLGRIEKLYAFTYQPPPPERELNGWELYDPLKEWARQGVDRDNHGWRISRINTDYTFSPTYPALLPVPSSISDNTLNYAGRYRSRARVPVLTYLHPVNNCSITRSSQPLVGVRGVQILPQTYALIRLAAQYSSSAYKKPVELTTTSNPYVSANIRQGTKAMVIKPLASDDLKSIVVAIRGTQSFRDWAVNMKTLPTAPENFLDDPENLCHAGFLTVAQRMVPSVAAYLRDLLTEDPNRASYSLTLTGHSAGGAVASLLYCHLLSTSVSSELKHLASFFGSIHCVTFGAPPVSIRPLFPTKSPASLGSMFYAFINEGDPVPRAEKPYITSLLNLYMSPAPFSLGTSRTYPFVSRKDKPAIGVCHRLRFILLGT